MCELTTINWWDFSVTPAASSSAAQQPAPEPAAPRHVTFAPAATVIDNSNITIPQQSHQLDSDDPFVASNNSDAMTGTYRLSLPNTQV